MPSLHRCACGGARTLTGSCAACEQKRLLGKPLQTKLRVSEQGDQYEQEADRVAAQVMRMSEVEVNGPRRDTGTPVVQRRATTGGTGVMEAPPIVHDVLNSPGQPLDAATRAFFEPRFGHDFSNVRVHADAGAAESARSVNALAYTVGRDVVFAAGQYAPTAMAGKTLLAHELSHVVQQSRAGTIHSLGRASGREPATTEQEEQISLSPDLATTHEILINGELFNLLFINGTEAPAAMHPSIREIVDLNLTHFPNLGSGAWAFIVRKRDGVFCDIGGNCLGWTHGTFDTNDPRQHVWALLPQFFQATGVTDPSGATTEMAYVTETLAQRFPPEAIWDYFMKLTFQALPAKSETEAHLALYGNGFAGSNDGPTHIAFRPGAGAFWVSKPSVGKPPIVHAQAGQLVGGAMGGVLRLYKSERGAVTHTTIRPKPTEPITSPQESMYK